MNEQLEKKLRELPEAPGIYKMLDKYGNIIYIGKSKCLKKRVQSYFAESPVWDKAKEMARFIENLEIVVTDTHLEAMLLECEMIKKHRPHFNAMMKNDERYSYLTLEENYRRNPLKITGEREGVSFGPFRSKGQIQDVIETLRNLYPITKKRSRYEVVYHIFPCVMEKEIFSENRKMLGKLFSEEKEMRQFLKAVEQEMKKAAETQSFERASKYRDLYLKLGSLQKSLERFEKWQAMDLVYRVPLDVGDKLFYISDGRVLFGEKSDADSEERLVDFMRRAVKTDKKILLDQSEKEMLDYRDIIYSELSQNPEAIYLVNKVENILK